MASTRLKPLAPFGAIAKSSVVVFSVLAILFFVGEFRRYLEDNDGRTTDNQIVNAQGNDDSSQEQGSGTNTNSSVISSQASANDQLFKRQLDANSDEYSAMDIDPAVEIKDRVWIYPDPSTPHLNTPDQYRRAAGDLARVQQRMLTNRKRARDYPWILLGNGSYTDPECAINTPTLGTYNSRCSNMQINFKDESLVYEYPIEVLTTMMHEQGHHMIDITVGRNNISRLEAELISDCFAGVMHGYWAKWDKLTKEEYIAAGKMMIQISKYAESTTDEHGDPGQRLGAFIAGAARASGEITPQYLNFCVGLDRVIDFSKGLP